MYPSLSDTCRRIKSGELSSAGVTRELLRRIEALEPHLKSYALVLADQALVQAQERDQARERGEPMGVLHGVPVAIKDLLFTAGIATASGTKVMADFIPDETATVVERLVAAGAVIVGKTQLTEGAFGAHHPEIEPPKNPYDLSRWPGVSSSGSGVAVAAGLAYGALGTDTGGSIRFPSACCGLVGIKPSYGRVSRHGAFPLAESLDHIGPMTRTVEDAARMLGVIAGEDPRDPSSSDLVVENYAANNGSVAGLTIGIDWDYVTTGVVEPNIQAVAQAKEMLAAEGVEIVDVCLPPAYLPLVQGWGVTCGVECARAHADYYPEQADLYGPALAALIELGSNTSKEDYQALEEVRRGFRRDLQNQFESVDALLIPTMPDLPQEARAMEAGVDDQGRAAFINFTAPYDYSGHPTITLPVGLSDGMPTSVQLVGPLFAESVLVQLGYALERGRGEFPEPDLTSLLDA